MPRSKDFLNEVSRATTPQDGWFPQVITEENPDGSKAVYARMTHSKVKQLMAERLMNAGDSVEATDADSDHP